MKNKGIEISKRGYPDFTVYDENGSIFGFVEVKSRDEKNLKQEQKVFSEFCHKFSIPFLKWSPKDGEEPLNAFLGEL
jgi:hypothetical protein